ncbi:YwaF family protein [Aestuariivivens insulae]|uniref:YwaF family protein n=1 Tax=Aestuariivivens insulae TaxID=1621988 RepID=UPI001F58C0F0|nr:TIGR02206 family membrane protein [Aestuariivivens insulae]
MNFNLLDLIRLQSRVVIGGLEHVIPIIIATLFAVFFIRYAKNKLDTPKQEKYIHYFACLISLTVLAFHLYYYFFGEYNIVTDLPLYLCSLMALLIPFFTYYKKYWMFEILVFWAIGGFTQGVITPDIAIGFPSFDYFRFWAVHLGVLIIVFYAIFVFNMRPKLASVFKSYFTLQGYVFIVILINYALRANYFYLIEKPKTATILDYFGEWPYYVIVVQIILIPYFLLIYLPFYLIDRKKNKNELLGE